MASGDTNMIAKMNGWGVVNMIIAPLTVCLAIAAWANARREKKAKDKHAVRRRGSVASSVAPVTAHRSRTQAPQKYVPPQK